MAGTDQTKLTNFLVWTAGAAFAASWFMPVLEDVPGWMAFRYALSPLVPYSAGAELPTWEDSVPQVLSALTNVMFVILFALWVFKKTMRPGLFVRIAIACLVLNLYWFVQAGREHNLDDLLIGYYLWLLAFALLLGVAIITAVAARRTSTTPTAGRPS